VTLHYRGDGPDALANAIVALLRHARASRDNFTFGPLRLADLERDGLTVDGEDIGQVMTLLAGVPGIAQVDQ
jgi:hypothetical protein